MRFKQASAARAYSLPSMGESLAPAPSLLLSGRYGGRGRAGGAGAVAGGERAAAKGRGPQHPQGERQGRGIGLRAGPLSGDALQGAVAQAARDGRRDSRLHSRQRGAAQDQGMTPMSM